MLSSVKLALEFDAGRMKAELDALTADAYVPHFNARYYQGDWSVLPLRSIGGAPAQIYPDPVKKDGWADTPYLERCPYIRALLHGFRCPLQSVRFLRLGPGSTIREHKDYNLSLEDGEIRLHIPVHTNPDVDFVVNGQRVEMRAGECWYHNFNLPHSVVNRGSAARVHLTLDCVVDEWLRGLVERAAGIAAPLV